MLDSLQVMTHLQNRYARLIGQDQLSAVLDGLERFIACSEPGLVQERLLVWIGMSWPVRKPI